MAYKNHISIFKKGFIFFLIFLLPLFIVTEFHLLTSKKDASVPPENSFYYHFVQEKVPKDFLVVIPVEGGGKALERTIQSVLKQKYQKFQVICIDRGMSEKALTIARRFSEKNYRFIETGDHVQGLKAYYDLILQTPDDTVVVHLNGDDWFAHEEVLEKVNEIYDNQDVMLAYGQYLEYPTLKKGALNPLPKKTLYKKRVHRAPWVLSPMKAFYAGIFKRVRSESIPTGYFHALGSPEKLLYPVAQQAKNHVRFIPEVLFVHQNHPIKKETHLGNFGESLATSMHRQHREDALADLVLLASHDPMHLKICLESIERHVKGVHQIKVLYMPHGAENYKLLQREFPRIEFHQVRRDNFKEALFKVIHGDENSPPYLCISTDSEIIFEDIRFQECIEAMHQSEMGAFMFNTAEQKLSLGCTLLKREDFVEDVSKLSFQTPDELLKAWKELKKSREKGLCFDHPKTLSFN